MMTVEGESDAVVPGGSPWGPWATLGFGLAVAVGFVLAQIAAGVVFSLASVATGHEAAVGDAASLQSNGLFLAVTTCGAAPVGVGLSLLFAGLRRGMTVWEYLGLKRVAGRRLLLWCLALVGMSVCSDGLSALLGRPLVPEVVLTMYRTAGYEPVLWLAVVVLAPLSEEIFFRGFLFAGWSRSRLGGWGAIFLTATLWAVIHLQYDWYGIATIFAAGLLLGYARLRTGSIVPAIVMHALMNLATTIEVVVLIRLGGK